VVGAAPLKKLGSSSSGEPYLGEGGGVGEHYEHGEDFSLEGGSELWRCQQIENRTHPQHLPETGRTGSGEKAQNRLNYRVVSWWKQEIGVIPADAHLDSNNNLLLRRIFIRGDVGEMTKESWRGCSVTKK